MKKTLSWCNSFHQEFRNGMLNGLAFVPEAPIQRFQSLWVSLWGQIHIYIYIYILMQGKHQVHSRMFWVVISYDDAMSPFIFLHGLRLNTETYIGPRGSSDTLNRECCCWKILCTAKGFCTTSNKQENPMLAVRKILWTHYH